MGGGRYGRRRRGDRGKGWAGVGGGTGDGFRGKRRGVEGGLGMEHRGYRKGI